MSTRINTDQNEGRGRRKQMWENQRLDFDEEELKDWDNWRFMIFGQFNINEVLQCVRDDEWQRVRISMLSTSRRFKFDTLLDYMEDNKLDDGCLPREVMVRVTNYVYALKRGGIIKEV